jgi:hypothetical protein
VRYVGNGGAAAFHRAAKPPHAHPFHMQISLSHIIPTLAPRWKILIALSYRISLFYLPRATATQHTANFSTHKNYYEIKGWGVLCLYGFALLKKSKAD